MPSPGDRLAAAVLFLLILAPACAFAHGDGAADADRRIAYYQERLQQMPALYPSMTELALAYLDKARTTSDPQWLAKARQMTEASLAVQLSFEAHRARMMIESHAHRFEEALSWARKAASASSGGAADPEPEIRAALVEIHLALGREEEAARMLPTREAAASQLEAAMARGHWAMTHGDAPEAAAMFELAVGLAHRAQNAELAGWASLAAARAELARGDVERAQQRMDQARPLLHEPDASALFAITRARILEAQSDTAAALAVLETALQHRPRDGELHANAWRAARTLGRDDVAASHFAAAEQTWRAAIDAGEVLTLGSLARLYVDAAVKLAEAKLLAERNLSVRGDRQSRELLAEATSPLRGQSP
ncbi:MAG TPA: hypothetical protein VEL28_13595 [Candidatus Binatia bacterium]|nr:hypothetical protein [Candidatus Binatia bacterium]